VIPAISPIGHHGFLLFPVAAAEADAGPAVRMDESFVQFLARFEGENTRKNAVSGTRGSLNLRSRQTVLAPILRTRRKSKRQLNSLEILTWICCCLAGRDASPRLSAFCVRTDKAG
jgi:hypothetical protein